MGPLRGAQIAGEEEVSLQPSLTPPPGLSLAGKAETDWARACAVCGCGAGLGAEGTCVWQGLRICINSLLGVQEGGSESARPRDEGKSPDLAPSLGGAHQSGACLSLPLADFSPPPLSLSSSPLTSQVCFELQGFGTLPGLRPFSPLP